jgi:hypothetical protein
MYHPPLRHLIVLTLACVFAGLASVTLGASPVWLTLGLTIFLAGYVEFWLRPRERTQSSDATGLCSTRDLVRGEGEVLLRRPHREIGPRGQR